jgi:tRNA (guanine37-N1)-methyltransferase
MRFDIFTLFPRAYDGPLTESILKRAQEENLIQIAIHDIRAWSKDRHRSVDDYPYGGGAGMVMMAPPIVEAVEAILEENLAQVPILLPSPSGELFNQEVARELAQHERLAIVCGRYEGIDQRVTDILGAREVSIGDFVMTGGDLAAALIVDVVSRLIPGVIDDESLAVESHSSGLLEYPHYTRPQDFRGYEVPEILLSGHHARIDDWRHEQSLRRTYQRRPDLLAQTSLNDADQRRIDRWRNEPCS